VWDQVQGWKQNWSLNLTKSACKNGKIRRTRNWTSQSCEIVR
jgi:hypothetical protein